MKLDQLTGNKQGEIQGTREGFVQLHRRGRVGMLSAEVKRSGERF